MRKLVLAMGLVALAFWVTACGPATPAAPAPLDDPLLTGSDDDRRAAADREFRKQLAEVQSAYVSCQSQLAAGQTCTQTANLPLSGRLAPQGLFEVYEHVCDVVRPFVKVTDGDHTPILFYGISVSVGSSTGQVGTDVVWDVWRRQLAWFNYGGPGIGSSIGGDIGAYGGWGFARDVTDVIDSWSGEFRTTNLSLDVAKSVTQALHAGANAGFFTSSDSRVYGGAVGIYGGFGIPTPLPPLGAALAIGKWTSWDERTLQEEASLPGRVRRDVVWVGGADGKQHAYIQFTSPVDMALAMAWKLDPKVLGAVPAAVATPVAFGILRIMRKPVSWMCPDDPDAAAPDPQDGATDAAADAAVATPDWGGQCPQSGPTVSCTCRGVGSNGSCGFGYATAIRGADITCTSSSVCSFFTLRCFDDPTKVCCASAGFDTRNMTGDVRCDFDYSSDLDSMNACCRNAGK